MNDQQVCMTANVNAVLMPNSSIPSAASSAPMIRHSDGKRIRAKITKIFEYTGLSTTESLVGGVAGNIVGLSGFEDIDIGDTLSADENGHALPFTQIDPPTLVFCYVADDEPEKVRDKWKPFCDHLSKVTGKPVEYLLVNSIADQLKALQDHESFPGSLLARLLGTSGQATKKSRHDPRKDADQPVTEEAFSKARKRMPSEFWVSDRPGRAASPEKGRGRSEPIAALRKGCRSG